MLMSGLWIVGAFSLAYKGARLAFWTLFTGGLLAVATFLSGGLTVSLSLGWVALLVVVLVFQVKPLRRKLVSYRVMSLLKHVMPTMSDTEREALEAGTVGFEAELFTGNPNWGALFSMPSARLSEEELAFIEGPVKELCRMIDDWEITHELTDMPPAMWTFIRENGFFGLIIPKEYGGKAFSAWANAVIYSMVYTRSITVATTISVPNSLGPAELLLDYGTAEQKNYYLPRLAKGLEIPCFALTAPRAGSDASSITDRGIVCYGDYRGENVLGVRLSFNKRYITFAPVATVIGLAFRMMDPDNLLGKTSDLGITCALIPADTDGIEVGRRHFPLNTGFMNGPIRAEDVFIPMDMLIGGSKMAGQGWRMLMESLSAGRAISLPSSALGGAQMAAMASGAYARIRRQFNLPIGRFEGVQSLLARMAARTYTIDAMVRVTAGIIDQGEKPSVASAIVKYHSTELARMVGSDAMDCHGGKAICMGPKNYLARGYQATPISITVEGANILTRNLIIFGQGAVRCHPYVYQEVKACRDNDLTTFDSALFSHIGFAISMTVRASLLSLTNGWIAGVPAVRAKRYLQTITRYSSVLAFMTEVSFASLGGDLKRREHLSARLGDILSYLYQASCVIKRYVDDGEPIEDWPIVRYACHELLFNTQEALISLLANFPNKWAKGFAKCVLYPFSKTLTPPRDYLVKEVAELMIAPSATRDRLCHLVFKEPLAVNPVGELEAALPLLIAVEPLLDKLRKADRDGLITKLDLYEQIAEASEQGVFTPEETKQLIHAERLRDQLIAVDDFDPSELARTQCTSNVSKAQSESCVKKNEKVSWIS